MPAPSFALTSLRGLLVLAAVAASITHALGEDGRAMDRVIIKRDGLRRVLDGRVLVTAQDGGVLIETRDTYFWMCMPTEIVERAETPDPFQPLDGEAVEAALKEQLPDGFRMHRTAHYVIGYNTTEVYARWCGALFERLYDGFYQFWRKQGIELQEPNYPLVAIIHRDVGSFRLDARKELGQGADVVIGYYSLQSNRINMYDLTGADGQPTNGRRIRTSAHINRLLSQPGAERTVATIVHEATHQLAYNSGLQTRMAGNPFWVSEGMAIFFESPDLHSSKGWRGIGAKHRVQLLEFRRGLSTRPPDSLRTMLADDAAFREAASAGQAYAQAWAFNYFLLRRHSEKYVDYLRKLAELEPLEEWSSEKRVAEFEASMESTVDQIDAEFLRYMRRVR